MPPVRKSEESPVLNVKVIIIDAYCNLFQILQQKQKIPPLSSVLPRTYFGVTQR